MRVHITYFESNGKWYTEGHTDVDATTLIGHWDAVRALFRQGLAPGLIRYEPEFHAVLTVPGHPLDLPRLIPAGSIH